MDLIVRTILGPPPGARSVEVVERKGRGHPDSICDAIAEAVCRKLCRHYVDRFGRILHHNVDKVLLCGGAATVGYGGGEIVAPIEILLAGRATERVGGARVPVHDLAVEACRECLALVLPGLEPRHVLVTSKLRPVSADLADLFSAGSARAPLANDTSCGAGFAPLTELERAVLAIERTLNDPGTKRDHPAIGADVKVMGVRRGRRADFTVACALVARDVPDRDAYVRATAIVRDLSRAAAAREASFDLDVEVNCADDLDRGRVYLTVTGSSAEAGDDGEVGRGNRVSGLITPYRAMTLEAAAGKNPVSHVGKIYNLVAHVVAEDVATAIPGVLDATCVLVSRIGHAVDDPQIVDVRVVPSPHGRPSRLRRRVDTIVRDRLARLDQVRDELIEGRIEVA